MCAYRLAELNGGKLAAMAIWKLRTRIGFSHHDECHFDEMYVNLTGIKFSKIEAIAFMEERGNYGNP